MAKKKGRAVRYVTRKVKSGVKRRKGMLSGQKGNMVIGGVAGFASPYIPRLLGPWTLPIVFGAAGYIAKKPVLMTLAAYELGRTLSASGLIGGLVGGGNGGGGSQI